MACVGIFLQLCLLSLHTEGTRNKRPQCVSPGPEIYMGMAQTHIEWKADTTESFMLAPEQYQHLWCPSMTCFYKALILQLQGA